MKASKNIIITLIALFAISASTFAQVSATANTSVTVITPIAISKSGDLNFGSLAASPTVAGTIVLAPAGTRTKTGGVTLPAVTGTVSAATFAVTGLGNSTYSITLPGTITLTGTPSGSMTVSTFTSTPSGTGTLSSGAQTIQVGGTLNVAAAQPAGSYTNTTGLTVTVNYN
jgi:hypothetical protein